MKNNRKFFQSNLRKDVDIKEYIASEMKNEMQKFSKQVEKFVKETARNMEESEK